MRSPCTLVLLGALALAPSAATAQTRAPATPQSGAAPAPSDDRLTVDAALEHAPRRPGELVTLSLENADLPELVRTMSEMTGKRFLVAAPAKSFQATVVSPQKVTVAEAYQAFLSILAANHLTVVPRGRFLQIIDAQDAAHEAPVRATRDGVLPEDRYVTYVHRVAHVPGEEMAAVLAKLASHDGAIIPYGNVLLLTDTGPSVQRMMRVLDELDVAQAEDKLWLEPLQYVPSADVKRELDEILDPRTRDKDKPGTAGTASAGDARVTKLVALDRPNALLVVGSPAGYERLLELLRAIDVATPAEGQMHVVMLQHADAKKIVGPLNEAVSAAEAPATGAAPGSGGASARTARVLDAPVKVSAEETSNALIVTAGAHDFAAVRDVIRRLDQPRRQVYIEAVVMDLSVQRTTAIGTAFHGFAPAGTNGTLAYGGSNPLESLSLPTDTSSLQALVLGIRGPSIPVPEFLQGALGTSAIPGLGFFLDAYTVASNSDILQTPHILATDNTPAEIHVQLNTSLQRNAASFGTAASTAGGGTSALSGLSLLSAPATANYGKIGPQIKITPHIDESDEVRLDVEETISDLGTSGPQGTLGTIDFTERGATTTLTVKDQHTAVIGGLVIDKVVHQVTKVPLLGDIPLLGALFRSSSDAVEKDNLVLVLTPTIVRNEDDMRDIFEKRMQERQEFLDHYFVFRDGPPVGFDPARGHGALAALRASYREVADRRLVESQVPTPVAALHQPRPAIDLPSPLGSAAVQGSTPPAGPAANLHVGTPPRSVGRVEH